MSTNEEQLPTGLIPDEPDARDFRYSDLFSAEDLSDVDFEKGYHAYEEFGLPLLKKDQGSSSSCVGQGASQHARVMYKKLTGQDVDFSPKYVYANINQGFGAGASLRDGVKCIAEKGIPKESTLPSTENGNPPSEHWMISKKEITEKVDLEAKEFDKYNYRMIPGGTTDIRLFAHAIKNGCGVVAGFTGTNPGWTRSIVRPPQVGESKWGHCVFLVAYGMYQGKRCVFTPNSWGGRYTITEGRWKGLQAIPEDYFTESADTAVGPAPGAYVVNSWVLIEDNLIPPNVKLMDFLKKNEGKLVQDVQGNGSFGIVLDGKILEATPERAAQLCLTVLMRSGQGVPVPKDLWNAAPKGNF